MRFDKGIQRIVLLFVVSLRCRLVLMRKKERLIRRTLRSLYTHLDAQFVTKAGLNNSSELKGIDMSLTAMPDSYSIPSHTQRMNNNLEM